MLCYLQRTEASRGCSCVGTGRGAGRCATGPDRDTATAAATASDTATAAFATAARETPPRRGSRRGLSEKKQRLPDSEPNGL